MKCICCVWHLSSPGIVAVECTRKTFIFNKKNLVKNSYVFQTSEKTSNLSAGLLRTAFAWRTFWSVQYLSEGKLLYTPSPANSNILFSSAFSPRWEKNKAAHKMHNDTVLGMYSQVNWIMEFFVCLGLSQFVFNFYRSLYMLTIIHHFGREHTPKSCLVNWVERKCSCLRAFSVQSVSACLCTCTSSLIHCGDQCTSRRYNRQFLILTVQLYTQVLHYVSLQNLQQSSQTEVTLSQRYFHFSDTLYQTESKSTPSISFSAEQDSWEAFWIKLGLYSHVHR